MRRNATIGAPPRRGTARKKGTRVAAFPSIGPLEGGSRGKCTEAKQRKELPTVGERTNLSRSAGANEVPVAAALDCASFCAHGRSKPGTEGWRQLEFRSTRRTGIARPSREEGKTVTAHHRVTITLPSLYGTLTGLLALPTQACGLVLFVHGSDLGGQCARQTGAGRSAGARLVPSAPSVQRRSTSQRVRDYARARAGRSGPRRRASSAISSHEA